MVKPNLFIIGSMKSGTSYLWKLLDAHPLVFMSEPKEPCYFVDPDDLKTLFPMMWQQQFWKDEHRYLSLFDTAEAHRIVGEASVFYSYLPLAPGVAERIHRFNPDARFIYLMRDPVERSLSHYWHNVRYFGEYRPLDAAVRGDIQYLEVGNYAAQLAEYYRFFDSSKVLALTFEELTEDPAGTMAAVFDWLGVGAAGPAPAVEPQNVLPAQFVGPVGKWQYLRQRNPLVRGAIDLLPRRVRKFGLGLVTRPVTPADADSTGIVDYLRPLQLRQIDDLRALVGRDFPRWTTLYRSAEADAAAPDGPAIGDAASTSRVQLVTSS